MYLEVYNHFKNVFKSLKTLLKMYLEVYDYSENVFRSLKTLS